MAVFAVLTSPCGKASWCKFEPLEEHHRDSPGRVVQCLAGDSSSSAPIVREACSTLPRL